MTKLSLIWSLVAAVVVGGAAVTTGYVYMDRTEKSADAPKPEEDKQVEVATTTQTGTPEGTGAAPADSGADEPAPEVVITEEILTFDVIGVEPTGETIVAGRSDAGSIVALTANGEVVGKGIANEKGEWTIILEKPLKPGDYDVGLEIQDDAGEKKHESSERAAVSVPEDGKSQPLVVVNKPDAPSDVLQIPEAVETAETTEEPQETVVAAASDDQVAPQAQTEPASESTAAASTGTEQAAEETPAAETVATANAPEQAPAQETETSRSLRPSAETETAESPASEPETASAPQETAAVDSASEQGSQTAATETEAPATQETVSAAAETAPESSSDEQETQAASAPQPEAAPAAQEAPAQMAAVEPGTGEGDADGTAQPATTTRGVEVTAAASSGEAETTPAPKPQVKVQAGAAETTAPAAPAPKVTVEAVESEKGKLYVAGTGTAGETVRIYVGDEYIGDARVSGNGRWLLQAPKDLKAGTVEVRADMIGKPGDTVVARAAVSFEKAEEQIVLTKVVATGAQANDASAGGASVVKALPNVIIRKGDNLWTISRRLYGEGFRYTTIYQANKGQIRNPDLIYPGQVFLTPEGDVNWDAQSN